MRLAARLLIAVALLLAQQAALAHQVWHLGKSDSQPAQTQLCEQHAALATVAGALDCIALDPPLVATVDVPYAVAARAAATAPRPSPTSRSPPRPLL
jgi:hypothetical protein